MKRYNFEEAIFAINPKGLVVVGGGFVWHVTLQNFQTIKWNFSLHIFVEYISSTAKIMALRAIAHTQTYARKWVGARRRILLTYVYHRIAKERAW